MAQSNVISLLALMVSVATAAFSWYQHTKSRTAKIELRMSIGRSYEFTSDGPRRGEVLKERNPTTRLLVRNMSSRPSALVEIRAKNPSGSILLDVSQRPPGGQMPLRLEPWGVEIIETEWPAGEHTEGLYFIVKDIDDKEYTVHDYTSNSRTPVGANVFQEIKRRSTST